MKRLYVVMILTVLIATSVSAATLILQNGLNGYSGCTDAFVYNRHASSTYIASSNEVPQGMRDFLDLEEDQA